VPMTDDPAAVADLLLRGSEVNLPAAAGPQPLLPPASPAAAAP
jgi:hypothetical protein